MEKLNRVGKTRSVMYEEVACRGVATVATLEKGAASLHPLTKQC
jgi:hypothetical protein